MTENRITESFMRGRIAYPQFEADAENKNVATINEFYRTLRDAAVAYMEEFSQSTDGKGRIFSADYTLRWEEDILVVEYVLLLRHRGRTEARKTLIHRWQNGYLIPPGKKRRQKRKIRLKHGAKEDII